MSVSVWCKCGSCTKHRADMQRMVLLLRAYVLLIDMIKASNLTCFTQAARLEEYVLHKPALQMAFIDAMVKKYVKGPAPEVLANQ